MGKLHFCQLTTRIRSCFHLASGQESLLAPRLLLLLLLLLLEKKTGSSKSSVVHDRVCPYLIRRFAIEHLSRIASPWTKILPYLYAFMHEKKSLGDTIVKSCLLGSSMIGLVLV
jgi:hypothetical protein